MRRNGVRRGVRGHGRAIRQPSLYSRTDEIKEKKKIGWIYPLVFCLLLGAVTYIIFFSPYLQVATIRFSDTRYVSREELEKVTQTSKGTLNNNIITFGFFNFKNRLGEVTGVKSFQIIRKFPNTINIEIVEKSPIFVWQILDRKYLVDENGYVWANYEDKYASLPVVVDTKNVPVQLGNKIVSPSFVIFVQDLYGNLEGTTGAKVVKVEVLDIVNDLKVTSSDGWYVYFDATRTAKNQLTSLVRVLEEVRNKKRGLEYVDLRIDNRIFYK
jgi:cell division protein FtsQ